MARDILYFIAIVAPDAIASEINAFKNDIRDNYSSKAALKTMPHITLKAPFKLSAEKRQDLLEWFTHIPTEVKTFKINTNNFGCFDNKHNKVIFVKPVMSAELIALQSDVIKSFLSAYPKMNIPAHEREFKAHMTIGYRDLTPENFEKAWSVYKDKKYQSSFTCHNFSLLQHNGMKWEVIEERPLPL